MNTTKPLLIGLPDTCPDKPPNVPENYVNALLRVGYEVRVLPYSMNREECLQMLSGLEAVLFMGGGDVEAKWFGEEQHPQADAPNLRRDEFEMFLFSLCLELRLPVFGICRGHQLINIALGGDIFQDLPSQYPAPEQRQDKEEYPSELINHSCPDSKWAGVHEIEIDPTSRLYQVLQVSRACVNSTHHQAVRKLGRTLRVTARSADGVIEALESDTYPIASVQFHPERLAFGNDTLFTPIFAKILDLAGVK